MVICEAKAEFAIGPGFHRGVGIREHGCKATQLFGHLPHEGFGHGRRQASRNGEPRWRRSLDCVCSRPHGPSRACPSARLSTDLCVVTSESALSLLVVTSVGSYEAVARAHYDFKCARVCRVGPLAELAIVLANRVGDSPIWTMAPGTLTVWRDHEQMDHRPEHSKLLANTRP